MAAEVQPPRPMIAAAPPLAQDRGAGAGPASARLPGIQGMVANVLNIHSPEITSMIKTAAAMAFTNIL